eukprot:353502-Chlamydomonas_euryale.AAC.2
MTSCRHSCKKLCRHEAAASKLLHDINASKRWKLTQTHCHSGRLGCRTVLRAESLQPATRGVEGLCSWSVDCRPATACAARLNHRGPSGHASESA